MNYNKQNHIIGGGTVSHVRPHLALTAPAYGSTARELAKLCNQKFQDLDTQLHLTKMANSGRWNLETNQDIDILVQELIEDFSTKIIFFTPAITDYLGNIIEDDVVTQSWKDQPRLQSRQWDRELLLTPDDKIVQSIRKFRKDIFLVAFKTTAGLSEDEQYIQWLGLLKNSSANLVLANDIVTRTNMIITPEEARYHVTKDRQEVLENLVDMSYLRSHLSFTRSTVVDGEAIDWEDELVPDNLRMVVDYCISQWAYKPFMWSTVWHFACKVWENTFLTSKRKTNFNDLHENGLVKIVTDGDDSVLAYGAKPSVWGQSQRIIFDKHEDLDCIVHFHCPMKPGSWVPKVSQREYECGSHECGENTEKWLREIDGIHAVFLDNHWPNIVFNHTMSADKIIDFIEQNFDLSGKTWWYVELEN